MLKRIKKLAKVFCIKCVMCVINLQALTGNIFMIVDA